MYERLMELYINEKLSINGLECAVKRKWITENQMQEIILSKGKETQ